MHEFKSQEQYLLDAAFEDIGYAVWLKEGEDTDALEEALMFGAGGLLLNDEMRGCLWWEEGLWT